jgi:asparagine N-glycosylation enzyme membrane subunit Stt3
LAAEARSKATGDIPDSQVFLSYHNPQAGYSMQYPEGWAQKGSGGDVTFQEKNNIVHILLSRGRAPTRASTLAELARERTLTYGAASIVSIQGAPVVKVSYSTVSAPNPVTGKRVQLLVDRYVYGRLGKIATVDLGTAKGVDNVDAYRMMSRSFRWQ